MQILRIYESPEFLTVHAHQIFFGLIFVEYTKFNFWININYLVLTAYNCADVLSPCL